MTPSARRRWTIERGSGIGGRRVRRVGGDLLHRRRDVGARQVGQEVLVQRELVTGAVTGDHGHFRTVAEQAGAEAPVDGGLEDGGVVGPRPPQIGRPRFRPVAHRGPLTEQRGVPVLGDAELIVPRPRAHAVEHGEDLVGSLGPLPTEPPHLRVVGRVVVHDQRLDGSAVDAAAVVDLLHEQLDGLGLLAVLDVGGEPQALAQGVEVGHGKSDGDAVRAHTGGTGAALVGGRRLDRPRPGAAFSRRARAQGVGDPRHDDDDRPQRGESHPQGTALQPAPRPPPLSRAPCAHSPLCPCSDRTPRNRPCHGVHGPKPAFPACAAPGKLYRLRKGTTARRRR